MISTRWGGTGTTLDQGGFGSFGNVYVNHDETNLYIGATGADMTGDNNGMIIFLGIDTLSDDKVNLWANSGAPLGLNFLQNVAFTIPVDIAILLSSEDADFSDGFSTLANGYAFGQGAFYLSSNDFDLVAGSRISQFDGTGTTSTVTTDGDGNALTDRWEACLPWASLNATNIESLSSLYVAGLIASDFP